MGCLILTWIGRTDDVVTASITTTVVMVVAGLSLEDARLQPILRFIDTVVGVAVGIGAVWISRVRPGTLMWQRGLARREHS